MKKTILLIIIAGCAITSYAQNSELNDYVNYIKGNNCNPVDYIFNLFEKSDIVVIGERDHRDTTQYELILDLLRDPAICQRDRLCVYRGRVCKQDKECKQITLWKVQKRQSIQRGPLHISSQRRFQSLVG